VAGGGFVALMANLPRERVTIGVFALAVAEQAFEDTLAFVKKSPEASSAGMVPSPCPTILPGAQILEVLVREVYWRCRVADRRGPAGAGECRV
jgi:hypothetical protein